MLRLHGYFVTRGRITELAKSNQIWCKLGEQFSSDMPNCGSCSNTRASTAHRNSAGFCRRACSLALTDMSALKGVAKQCHRWSSAAQHLSSGGHEGLGGTPSRCREVLTEPHAWPQVPVGRHASTLPHRPAKAGEVTTSVALRRGFLEPGVNKLKEQTIHWVNPVAALRVIEGQFILVTADGVGMAQTVRMRQETAKVRHGASLVRVANSWVCLFLPPRPQMVVVPLVSFNTNQMGVPQQKDTPRIFSRSPCGSLEFGAAVDPTLAQGGLGRI